MMSREKQIIIFVIVCALVLQFPAVAFAEGPETYTVSFNSLGGADVDSITAENGSLIVKPDDPSWPGRIFSGWYKEQECLSEWKFETDTITADLTLFAKWKDDVSIYTIMASSSDPAYGEVSGGGDYTSGDTVTLTELPKDGCRFVRWVESGSTSAIFKLTASANLSITAEFLRIDTPSLKAVPSGYNSITLSWSSLEYAAGYEIYRSTDAGGEYSRIHKVNSGEALNYIDKGLAIDTKYFYKVLAFCMCETAATYGNLSEPVSATPSLAVPSVSASAGGYRSIRVSWNIIPGASGYEVSRSSTPDGTYTKVDTLKFSGACSYNDYKLTANSTYYYKVRAYLTADNKIYYSDYSDIQSAQASLAAPSLHAVSASNTSIQLTWNMLPGVSGYELYRCTSENGTYSKVYTATSAPTIIYTNTSLKNGTAYYYKLRAYGKQGTKKIYGPYSPVVSAIPSTELEKRAFTILYQGDPRWGFPTSVRKRACLLSSYAITINNMGIEANPRTVYESNGNTTCMNFTDLAANFKVKPVCAINLSSPYLRSYNGCGTYIKSPSRNARAAIKEALNKHPEGVICYFRRGNAAHAIVACKYDGDTIYYSDPGRRRTTLLTFNNTWVRYHHRMGYGNLSYIVALDEIED